MIFLINIYEETIISFADIRQTARKLSKRTRHCGIQNSMQENCTFLRQFSKVGDRVISNDWNKIITYVISKRNGNNFVRFTAAEVVYVCRHDNTGPTPPWVERYGSLLPPPPPPPPARTSIIVTRRVCVCACVCAIGWNSLT